MSSANNNETVVSPVFGQVEKVDAVNGIIGIYIPRDADHNVFAPITAVVTRIQVENGALEKDVFLANENSVGRVRLWLLTAKETEMAFSLEVGEGYITRRVLLEVEPSETIHQGQAVAYILLGSRSAVKMPTGALINVKPGDVLVGGVTKLGTFNE